MNKNLILLVVALLVGVVVGFFVERQRAIYKMEAAKLSFQNQIDEARMVNEKLIEENKQLQMSLTPTPEEEPTGAMKKVTPSPSAMKK